MPAASQAPLDVSAASVHSDLATYLPTYQRTYAPTYLLTYLPTYPPK